MADALTVPDNVNKLIAERWIARREAQGLKRKTLTCKKLQLEFFLGAYAALEALGAAPNNLVLVLLASGRDAEDLM